MDWPADLDPAALRQPDGFSCGPTAVVAARMLTDPDWRPGDTAAEVARTHRRLTSVRGVDGRAQLPWPRPLGTPPWSVATALAGLSGEEVRSLLARWRPAEAYEELVRRVATRPVGVYLGNRWLPRHVVLAFAASGDATAVRLFDPARGALVTVASGRWRRHAVGVAGWSHFWAVV